MDPASTSEKINKALDATHASVLSFLSSTRKMRPRIAQRLLGVPPDRVDTHLRNVSAFLGSRRRQVLENWVGNGALRGLLRSMMQVGAQAATSHVVMTAMAARNTAEAASL